MTTKKRELGFYWVKLGCWIVSEWTYHGWKIPGSGRRAEDTMFDQIDERRITREEQKR